MAKKLDDVMADLPAKRRAKIEKRATELATVRNLRQRTTEKTQKDIAPHKTSKALSITIDDISKLI